MARKNADELQVELMSIIRELAREWNRDEDELVYLTRSAYRIADEGDDSSLTEGPR